MVCSKEMKSWGNYEIIHGIAKKWDEPSSITKVLTVLPGTATSLQAHSRRTEEWTIIEGELYVEVVLVDNETGQYDGICRILKIGEHISIPKGAMHRFSNISDKVAKFIEVQVGICHEEDILRFVPSHGWNED